MSIEDFKPQKEQQENQPPVTAKEVLPTDPRLKGQDTKKAENKERQQELLALHKLGIRIDGEPVDETDEKEKTLEERVEALNGQAKELGDQLSPELKEHSIKARWASGESGENVVRNGKSAHFLPMKLSDPRTMAMIKRMHIGMGGKQGTDYGQTEFTPEGSYQYINIAIMERMQNGDTAEWRTDDVAREETKEMRMQFDEQIRSSDRTFALGASPSAAAESLKPAHDPQKKLEDIMHNTPKGTDKTVWGRVMTHGSFKMNAEGKIFFCVPPGYAPEFRTCAHRLFNGNSLPDFRALTMKDAEGGYAVELDTKQANRLILEAKLRVTDDVFELLSADEELKNNLETTLDQMSDDRTGMKKAMGKDLEKTMNKIGGQSSQEKSTLKQKFENVLNATDIDSPDMHNLPNILAETNLHN